MTAMLELGAFIGAIQAGFLADRFSRKITLFIGLMWFTLGSTIQTGECFMAASQTDKQRRSTTQLSSSAALSAVLELVFFPPLLRFMYRRLHRRTSVASSWAWNSL